MKAIVMQAPGEPEVLQLASIPAPTIQQPTEMLVRLVAAGINPIDLKLRQRGTFYPDRQPTVLGCDGAGVVEAVGAGVTRFRVGDAVYFCSGGLGGSRGNYAELAVVDERFAAPKPRSLTFEEAAAAPLVLITAWEALYDRGRLEAGRKVLVHAGAGGVGHVAIQLAKLKGAAVCATVSTEEKAAFVTSLGCDRPIRYQHEDFVAAALEWTEGMGVELAFDTVGGDLLERTFPAVQVYGDLVTILEPAPTTNWKIARNRNLRVSLELMLSPALLGLTEWQQHQAKILAECAHLFDRGELQVRVQHLFPLTEAAAAHRLLASGGAIGKLVLKM